MNYPATPTARRLLDYLAARPDVDPQALAATGHSGGGENTLYLGAYDQRLAATAVIDGMDDWAFRLDYGLSRCPEHYPEGFLARGDYSTLLALHAPVPTLVLSGESDFVVSPSPVVEVLVQRAAVAFQTLGAGDYLRHLAFPGGHSASRGKREAIYGFFAEVLGHPELAGPEDGTVFKDSAELHLTVPSSSLKTLDLVAALINTARDLAPAPAAPPDDGELPTLPDSGELSVGAVEGGKVLYRQKAPPLPFRVFEAANPHALVLCFADPGAGACLPLAGALAAQGVEVWAVDPTGFGELADDWPLDDGWKRLRLANYLILDGRPMPLRVAADLRDLALLRRSQGELPVAVMGLGVKAAWLALLASALSPQLDAAVALGPQVDLADEYLEGPLFPMPADLYVSGYSRLGGLARVKALAGRKPLLVDSNPDPRPLARTICRFVLKAASAAAK
jgi:dienelactone hydrolase